MASFLRPSKADTKHACAIRDLSHARAAQRDLSRLSIDTIFASKCLMDRLGRRI